VSDTSEPIGECKTPDGTVNVLSMFRTIRDDREVTLMRLGDNSIALVTESWLKVNDRKQVTTSHRFTEGTLAMMLQTILLGAGYIGIDLKKAMKDMSVGDRVEYECDGNGEFELKDSFGEAEDV
jgi:hypothetical protein